MNYDEKVDEIAMALYGANPVINDDTGEIIPWQSLHEGFKESILFEAVCALGCIIKKGPPPKPTGGGWSLRFSSILRQWRTDNVLCAHDTWWADLPDMTGQPEDGETTSENA